MIRQWHDSLEVPKTNSLYAEIILLDSNVARSGMRREVRLRRSTMEYVNGKEQLETKNFSDWSTHTHNDLSSTRTVTSLLILFHIIFFKRV